MLRASEELVAVFRRVLVAFERRDVETLRGVLSDANETLIIGSDVGEWLEGIEATEVFLAQVKEMPPVAITVHRLDAFEEGTVGWVAADTTTKLDSGATARFRHTVVFRLEGGVWKVVHWHASVPENSEGLGIELTTSLSQLLESLNEDDVEELLRRRFSAGILTLLFTDIEESTSLAGMLGDAVWTDLVHRHFADVQRIASEQEGVVVKTIGDGAMIAFESVHNAVRAAAKIEASVAAFDLPEELRVRMGVHAGDTLHSDGDYFGLTVKQGCPDRSRSGRRTGAGVRCGARTGGAVARVRLW